MEELISGETRPGELYIIKSPELLQDVCNRFGDQDLLAYVNREWVLAPGFNKNTIGYPDVSITGSNSNCSRLSLPDFLTKYQDKLLILSAMEDISSLNNGDIPALLRKLGLNNGFPAEPGLSYAAVVWDNQVIIENHSPQKIEFSTARNDRIGRKTLPVDLQINQFGAHNRRRRCCILVNNRDYSYHQNGLNIAVVDPSTGRSWIQLYFSRGALIFSPEFYSDITLFPRN